MKEVTIEGRQPVLEALKAGRKIKLIYIAESATGKILEEIRTKAREKKVSIREISRNDLDRLSVTGSEQGVVALGEPKAYAGVEDIFEVSVSKGEDPFVLALDQIQDPQNLGSIIRTAEAAGVHGIIIPKNRAVTVTPSVEKASAGAVGYIEIAQSNIAAALDFMKSKGCWVIGTDSEAAVDCFEADLTGPVVLVVGSEGQGIRRLVKEKCDLMVKLPMLGHLNSLNAANAASVLMYEILRQRRKKV